MNRYFTPLAVIAFVATLALLGHFIESNQAEAATNALERHSPTNYPHPEWVRGFEAGVRYGLIAFLEDPKQDDIPVITDRAKFWYYRVVVDPTGSINRAIGKTNAP